MSKEEEAKLEMRLSEREVLLVLEAAPGHTPRRHQRETVRDKFWQEKGRGFTAMQSERPAAPLYGTALNGDHSSQQNWFFQ